MDHQSYAHYGALQHVNLQSLRKEDEKQFNELKEKGFQSRFTGYVFSAIHSEPVIELYNKETNISSVNTSVNTIHIYP